MDDVADLGSIEGDVLPFGGIVSNAHALAAFAALAARRGIAGRQMVSTGDVVAYCGRPAEAVVRLRGLGAAAIRGNCEERLAAGAASAA